jgi:hypothetical protein
MHKRQGDLVNISQACSPIRWLRTRGLVTSLRVLKAVKQNHATDTCLKTKPLIKSIEKRGRGGIQFQQGSVEMYSAGLGLRG